MRAVVVGRRGFTRTATDESSAAPRAEAEEQQAEEQEAEAQAPLALRVARGGAFCSLGAGVLLLLLAAARRALPDGAPRGGGGAEGTLRPPPPPPPPPPPGEPAAAPPGEPPPSPSPSPPSLPPPPDSPRLSSAKCDAMLRDPKHLFRRMWASEGWGRMTPSTPACWGRNRERPSERQRASVYFSEAARGDHCNSNWYHGNFGFEDGPHFSASSAPALLGFDDEIAQYCVAALPPNSTTLTPRQRLECYAQRYSDLFAGYCGREWGQCDWEALEWHWAHHGRAEGREFSCTHIKFCTRANFNLLNLVDKDKVPYNMCRNLEWQVCAAKGLLPGQGGGGIRFSYAPKQMEVDGEAHSLGTCAGWHPGQTPAEGGGVFGFTNDDIYFMEICLFNQICDNRDELFSLARGDTFRCAFSAARFAELEALLRSPAEAEPSSAQHCTIAGPRTAAQLRLAGAAAEAYEWRALSCEQCASLRAGLADDCSDLRDCEKCEQCAPHADD